MLTGVIMSFCHMRIAVPVSELDTTASMYCAGLGLEPLGSFTDHEGFSGIMLGAPEAGWHLEFTHCRHHPVTPRQAMKICWCCTIRSRRHGSTVRSHGRRRISARYGV